MAPANAACSKPWYGSAYAVYHRSSSHYCRKSLPFTLPLFFSPQCSLHIPLAIRLPTPEQNLLKMSPPTRNQTLARRKSLRIHTGWEMFRPALLKPVTTQPVKIRRHPQKPSQRPPQKFEGQGNLDKYLGMGSQRVRPKLGH